MEKMKIAINIKALKTDYRIHGTGIYIQNLISGLKAQKDKNEYIFAKSDREAKNADLVHIPYFSAYLRSLPIRKPANKLVVTVHDLMPIVYCEFFPPGIKGILNWRLQKYLLAERVDHIIADSKATKRDIVEYAGIPEDKISVAYLGADKMFKPLKFNKEKLKEEMRKKYNLPEKFVLYVGDILWSKNIPALIEAAREINVSLVFVGKRFTDKTIDKSHPWNKDIVKAQKAIEEDKRLMALGYVSNEDLIKLYNAAALLCQPSHCEGFGLTVLEAMSCGCPVVVSNRGSLPEIVGKAGIYVDPADTRSIADGIGEIYFNANLYKKYRKLGLEQAKKFSWEKTVSKTVGVYNELLTG
jgi:glycosyltransferase involved in cell wall biosynthesis